MLFPTDLRDRAKIRVMVFNATFNNSSVVISWRSVLLMEYSLIFHFCSILFIVFMM